MRVTIGLLAAFFLSACDAQNITLTPHERYGLGAGPSVVSDTVEVTRFFRTAYPLEDISPVQVSVTHATVCEAADIVLDELLGVAYGCTASGGDISLGGSFRSADALFATFVRAARLSGAQVDLAEGSVAISGAGGGRSVGGFAGDVPPDVEGAQAVQGVEAFTTNGQRLTDIAIAGFFQNLDISTGYAHGADPDQVRAAIVSLGLSLEVIETEGAVQLVGYAADIDVLRSFLAGSSETVAMIPFNGAPQPAVDMLAGRHFVEAVSDAQTRSWVVSGTNEDVTAFSAAVRRLGGASGDIRIDAAFIRSSVSDLESLGVTPGVAFDLGDIDLRFGDVVGSSPISIVVDALTTQAGVNADIRPTVTASPGANVRFVSGREVPVVVSRDEDGATEVEYRTTGAIINATAVPLAGGFIRLVLQLEVSSVDGDGVLDNPSFSSRSISTEVVLRPGSMVLLSGLDSETTSQERRRTLGIFPARGSGSSTETLSFIVSVDQGS